MKSRWQKFIAITYVFSYVFSLAALILTVVALSLWPSRIYEKFGPTRWMFSTFGLFWGGLIIGLRDIGMNFGPPILIVIMLRHLKDGKIAKIVRFSSWAFIEAYGVSLLATGFLDTFNNVIAINLVLSDAIGREPFTPTFLLSVFDAVLIVVSLLSFSVRIIRHIKSTRLPKKAST